MRRALGDRSHFALLDRAAMLARQSRVGLQITLLQGQSALYM